MPNEEMISKFEGIWISEGDKTPILGAIAPKYFPSAGVELTFRHEGNNYFKVGVNKNGKGFDDTLALAMQAAKYLLIGDTMFSGILEIPDSSITEAIKLEDDNTMLHYVFSKSHNSTTSVDAIASWPCKKKGS